MTLVTWIVQGTDGGAKQMVIQLSLIRFEIDKCSLINVPVAVLIEVFEHNLHFCVSQLNTETTWKQKNALRGLTRYAAIIQK